MSKRPTMQEMVCRSLLRRGFHEVQSKTRKARTFANTDGRFLFVGKCGSVRSGICYTKSHPINPALKRILARG
jgi:hypothetical protein